MGMVIFPFLFNADGYIRTFPNLEYEWNPLRFKFVSKFLEKVFRLALRNNNKKNY